MNINELYRQLEIATVLEQGAYGKTRELIQKARQQIEAEIEALKECERLDEEDDMVE